MGELLRLLIVEDDTMTCNNFQNILENEQGINLIGITNNSKKAVSYIKDCLPDAVILDLELHAGGGNGIEVLKDVNSLFLPMIPYFILTTNNTSSVTYEMARSLGADFIMYKQEDGYSENKVIDFLKSLSNIILNRRKSNIILDENPSQKQKRLTSRIHAQFNLIGISPKVKGFIYLTEAILLIYNGNSNHLCSKIAQNHQKSESSVERAMQNAISKAWSTTDVDTLIRFYTCKIQSQKGTPTITEFSHYYANILKNEY